MEDIIYLRNIFMNNNDPVSFELRQVENEIDNFYKSNILMSLPFAEAVWYLLAFYEDIQFKELISSNDPSPHSAAVLADFLVTTLEHPLLWIWKTCKLGGTAPQSYNAEKYKASWDLADLGKNYLPFDTAFTYASRGRIKLELKNNELHAVKNFFTDSRYEAYDRLVKPKHLSSDSAAPQIRELIEKTVIVSGDKFRYSAGRKVFEKASKILSFISEERFELPENWRFPKYNLKEFRRVASTLTTLTFVHFAARLTAISKGCKRLGYPNSVLVINHKDLIWDITRYSGVSFEATANIVSDLTYGNKSIRKPDPALQPIIKINKTQYILAPSIFLSSSMERNFIVLINRLPDKAYKSLYSKIVDEKEDFMRENIKHKLKGLGFRFFSGKFSTSENLPDIDLAIISESEKVVLLLELKWFIEPSEPREVLEKSEEISKGISQAKLLAGAYVQKPDMFVSLLQIDKNFHVSFAVASQNSIGEEQVQDPNVPVIRVEHLIEKLKSEKEFKKVIGWLSSREYLPTLSWTLSI